GDGAHSSGLNAPRFMPAMACPARAAGFPRTLSLARRDRPVLGAGLNCFESRQWQAPSIAAHACAGPRFYVSSQASAEHFQQCAEFLPLRNRGLGPLAVTVLPIPLARRGAVTACAGLQVPSTRHLQEPV